jgi:hypothetical protein
MMQRDEDLLLEGWLRYHGYLFGFENLEIFDNGSTDPHTIETLRIYEAAGCHVHRQFDKVADFHGKGFHFENVIKHYDASEDYDFAFPLDCDEFVTVLTPDGISCSRRRIHDHLDTLTGERGALRVAHCLFNAPGRPGHFWAEPYPKGFLASNTVGTIDHGFHAVTSRVQDGVRGTNIAYLHFHNKPLADLLRHARHKLEHFVDVDDPEALRAYDGPGLHMISYFEMSEADYRAKADDKLLVMFGGFARLIRALGIDSPLLGVGEVVAEKRDEAVRLIYPAKGGSGSRAIHIFDGERYLDANPDLRTSGILPLSHYLAFGYQEGRSPARQTNAVQS